MFLYNYKNAQQVIICKIALVTVIKALKIVMLMIYTT